MRLTVTEPVADHGTIVLMQGIEIETDRVVTFACDHRPAQDIVNALAAGEDVEVEIEDWQVMSAGSAPSAPAG